VLRKYGANTGTILRGAGRVARVDPALQLGVATHDVEHEQHRTVDGTHGRIEERHYWVIRDPDVLAYLNPKQAWAGLTVSAW